VNPQQEAQADALQVATGLSSLSAKLRSRGENPDKVFAEIKSDFDRLKADGTLEIMMSLLGKQMPAETPQPAQPE
jgi:capsid protein